MTAMPNATSFDSVASQRLRPSALLTRAERRDMTRKSDAHAAWLVLSNWASIFGLLWFAAAWPGVWSALVVWVLLPGRQLGLAVLMHEAGHGSLFTSPVWNRWIGQWLCALPTLGDLHSYALGHTQHHRQAGSRTDPDLPNYAAYPITAASFRRKVIRDLTGQTGFKLLASIAMGAAGAMGRGQREGAALLVKQVAVQLTLAATLVALGIGWTWWLWAFTFMTSYMLVVRLRQVAEHAGVDDLYDLDPRRNTRTVVAPLWQRLVLAPHNVNYHMEHHFMAGVPCYRLPAFHQLLREKGLLEGVPDSTSYLRVFRGVINQG